MSRKPISAKMRFMILERDHFTCQCCGGSAPNFKLHVDHIVAVANGGSNEPSNLHATCETCNLGKGVTESNVLSIRRSAHIQTVIVGSNEVECRGEPLSEPVFWIGWQWAVTSYGVECRDGRYHIAASRIWEDENVHGWEKHMGEKDWVDVGDFSAAIDWARNHFSYLRRSA